MSIIRLLPENFQTYNLIANPKKSFRSSSHDGLTGSISLFSDASPSLKDLDPTFGVAEEGYDDSDIEQTRLDSFIVTHVDTKSNMGPYMDAVNAHPQGDRQKKRQEVIRFIPGARLDKNHGIKSTIKNILFPYYQHVYQSLNWGYTNYNSLNFFKSNNTPNDSALIYPALTSSTAIGSVNYYAPSSSFTFDFYVKPKVDMSDNPGAPYHAGTILHMSSCYAISLVSGSSVGPDGKSDKFRVLLQLSQSADIAPSNCTLTDKFAHSLKGDPGFLFCSSDNALSRNEWHHISIAWPGGLKNGGSGSISIDGKDDTTFVMLSSSVMAATKSSPSMDDPNGLFIGNYYEGSNLGNQAISRFFNPGVASDQGLTPFSGIPSLDPTGIRLDHPLQAEVHEIKIYNTEKTKEEKNQLRKKGPKITNDLVFYVPPFFVQESRRRNILQTPFHETQGITNDPFNTSLSFGVGGLEINLENFTRELIKSEYPRLHNMTSSVVTTSVFQTGRTSDDILYSSGSSIKRLYTILPCDNGKFVPNFNLLNTGSLSMVKFVDAFGGQRLDLINLENMVSDENIPYGLESTAMFPTRSLTGVHSLPEIIGDSSLITYGTGSFLFDLQGASPEDPSVAPGNILTILQRTGDTSSNQVVFFDASNIFYGDKIRPGSLLIEDLHPTGSAGSFQLNLRDNKLGNIYRADTNLSGSATWASVGNILYEEGIIVLKSPHLSMFGKEDYRITFEGERKVYVFEVSVSLPENLFNSSSNPQYKKLMPTGNNNEASSEFSYVTGIQLHDDNLNVIGRAHLAQPFSKRDSDKVVIKLRMDY